MIYTPTHTHTNVKCERFDSSPSQREAGFVGGGLSDFSLKHSPGQNNPTHFFGVDRRAGHFLIWRSGRIQRAGGPKRVASSGVGL